MAIFFSWITFSIVAALIGKSRKIGGFKTFLISIFLTPLVGLIFAFNSEKTTEKATPAGMLDLIYKGNDLAAAGKRQEAIEVYKSALIYSEKSPMRPIYALCDYAMLCEYAMHYVMRFHHTQNSIRVSTIR
jgi:hypothetical protein